MSAVVIPEWTQLPPIKAAPHACYLHGTDEFYHVGAAVAEIRAAPYDYCFVWIESGRLAEQLAMQGNVDLAYAASLSEEDAARPLLAITYPNGSIRIIDGYHRATRAIQLEATYLGVWVLTKEQTKRFSIDASTAMSMGLVSAK